MRAKRQPAPPPSPRRVVFAQVSQWVSLGCRLLLAGVLGYAAFAKVLDPLASGRAVRAYQLLPESLVQLVGFGLPFLEFALAGLLLLGVVSRYVAGAGGVLLLVFIAGIASVWARGLHIDCGCFGGGGEVAASETQYPLEILRDTGLVLAAAWVAVFPPGRFALDRLFGIR